MTDARAELIEEIFFDALDREPQEREAYLVDRCGADCELLATVREMIEHDAAAGQAFLGGTRDAAPRPGSGYRSGCASGFSAASAAGHSDSAAAAGGSRDAVDLAAFVHASHPGELGPARVLGRYTISRRIGEGGMGCVYEAQQDHPRRAVALKVMRSDCAARDVVRRFELEAQALGQLQHPGIAQVFEAGTLTIAGPDGERRSQPFLAMERIRGVPLDAHVREHRLAAPAILAIVARIADAVHHAHGRGVIHRDLKPGNILVDQAGAPKVLDFGIARLTHAGAGSATAATQAGQLIGTLPYMSPEQVLGERHALDARTDVYSLGVVAYEALTGRLPLDVRGRSVPDAARVIREDEPTRLGLVDAGLRGEVETIVAKAMAKDCSRRYQTAAELAADIRRFLSHEPIRARPASSMYQLRKFAQRNRALVGGVAAVLAALSIGCVGMAYLAHQESVQRIRAEDTARSARALAYRSTVHAAYAALDAGDAGRARALLDEAPAELRRWEWRHLDWMTSRFDRTLTHPAGATCAVPTPDGARILVGGRDGSVCVLDAQRGDLLAAWPLTRLAVRSIVLARAGERVLVGDLDGFVVLDGRDGRELWRVDAPGAGVSPDGAAPDGSVVAVRTPGSFAVEIRDLETGALRRSLPVAEADALLAQFSPDGRRIAIGTLQKVELRDWETGAVLWSLEGCTSHGFSSDGRRLSVVPCVEGAGVQIIDASSGATLARESLADAREIALSDGQGFDVTGDIDGGMSVRDPISGRVLARAPSEGVGPILFDGGTRVLSRSGAGDVRTWSLATLVGPLEVMSTNLSNACAVATGGRCAVNRQWENLRGWDLDTGRATWSRRFPRRTFPEPSISADGTRVGADLGDELHLLDGATGATIHVVPLPLVAQRQTTAWAPDGSVAFRGGADGALRAIDCGAGSIRAPLRIDADAVSPLACTPDAQRVLVAIGDRAVALVSATDGAPAWRVADLGARATCAAFSRDGDLVAIGDGAGAVAVRDARTGRLRGRMGGGGVALQTVSFHPTEPRLAAASDDGVTLYDVEEEVEVLRLRLFRGIDLAGSYPTNAAFTADGKRLCVARGRLRSFETESDTARFAQRLRACEAALAVEATAWPLALASDLCAALEARTDLSPQRRADAIEHVRARGDQLNALNGQAWEAVARSDATAATYRYALRASERVCEAIPDDWALLNTLGLAQLRAGDPDAAARTMRRCDELHRAAHGGASCPLDLVILAMALDAGGRGDDAASARASAVALLQARATSTDLDSAARLLLTESERRASARSGEPAPEPVPP